MFKGDLIVNKLLDSIFDKKFDFINETYLSQEDSEHENQSQTNEAFSLKWTQYSREELSEQEKLFRFQKEWYLKLYGFESERELAKFLSTKAVILDAGCGLGYKAEWFAQLSPESTIIGMDFSDAAYVAADKYKHVPNLFFVKGDIANTNFKNMSVDYVSCDQVIHHTQDVAATYKELTRILSDGGEFAVYVYAKKALPRELLDDHFREASKTISHDDMMTFSEQLTDLGKMLTDLNVSIDVPDIPLLGIKGGETDLQRFVYWNFLKCFWNEELGRVTSISTNYDWYSPSNAYRYSINEFLNFASINNLSKVYLHTEEACHSGRFRK
jgi:ubiquinone/menaquinone biosynthesis C-methylase UbiE